VDNTATLGSSPVRALRLFNVDQRTTTLKSLNGEVWTSGEVKRANCSHAPHHEIHEPHVNCTCGIWSCKSRKHLSFIVPAVPIQVPDLSAFWLLHYKPPTYVSAQIDQWGVTIEHVGGYRSEYARIIPETIQWWPRPQGSDPRKKYLNHIRTKYGAWQV
jgi:hypothetical protein